MIFIPVRYVNRKFTVLMECVCHIGIAPDTVIKIRRFSLGC